MKHYHIYIDNEQKGPFSLEELKEQKITNQTLVWFEGQTDWQKASEIEELVELFKSTPPPIKDFSQTPEIPEIQISKSNIENEENGINKILGINKNAFFIFTAIIVISIIALTYYQNYNKERIEQINSTTEVHNQQIEQQQKEIDEQKAQLAKQEQIEAQRKAEEKQESLEKRYAELNNEVTLLYDQLQKAKKHLNDVTAFKLLRTSSERNEQINNAQNEIDIINEEIKHTEEEMNKINYSSGIK